MSDNSKIWQLCLDTLEKQNLPEERKIDKVIMESVFRSAKIASINNNKVIITIKDSGGGFAPEVVDRIFEPFFTTKRRGMGLGLAIVSEIVRNSNGALHASNHPEGGAVMTLTWPEWGEEHE